MPSHPGSGGTPRKHFVDIGQRFGRGVVIATELRIPRRTNPVRMQRGVRLRCDCGTVYETLIQTLVVGACSSCGCLRREVTAERSRRHVPAVAGA